MIAALKHLADGLLGRGEASITVPPFDGQLKPNQLLETASVIAELDAPEDLATDGEAVFVANAEAVLRLATARTRRDRALRADSHRALLPAGWRGCGRARGQRVAPFRWRPRWQALGHAGWPAACRGQRADAERRRSGVLVTDGSSAQPYERWHHDLMARGHSGRLVMLDLNGGSEREIATGLAYAFGACAAGPAVWVQRELAPPANGVWRSGARPPGAGELAGLSLAHHPGRDWRLLAYCVRRPYSTRGVRAARACLSPAHDAGGRSALLDSAAAEFGQPSSNRCRVPTSRRWASSSLGRRRAPMASSSASRPRACRATRSTAVWTAASRCCRGGRVRRWALCPRQGCRQDPAAFRRCCGTKELLL